VLNFFLLGVAIFVVYLILAIKYLIQKRSFFEHVLLLSVVVYFSSLIKVTLFPLPIQHKVIVTMSEFENKWNFIPTKTILEYIRTLVNEPRYFESTSIQFFGNIFMLAPLGFLLPMLTKKSSLSRVVMIGFLTSVSVEVLQMTISFIVTYHYRSVDVDDVILNTIGITFGYFAFKICKSIFIKFQVHSRGD
jgi:glycopeptide antibiotics resistance protein